MCGIASILRRIHPVLLAFVALLHGYSNAAEPVPQTGSSRSILLITPPEGSRIVAKKPLVKCAIKEPFDPQRLLVILDKTDITAILDLKLDGFEYSPPGIMASGSHNLSVTAYTPDGKELKGEFTFSTRHSEMFEEAYSGNEITGLFEKRAIQSEETTNQTSWKTEINLASESKLREKGWEFAFKTNVRHFDQELGAASPLSKGFNLADYLLQGRYTYNTLRFLGELGDVQINETPNTVQGLARRGGNFIFQSKDLHVQLRGFVVKSDQLVGFKGGLGVEPSSDDHIMGVSGDLGLISEKIRLKTVFVKGGEEGNSLGISTTGGKRKGDVLGFLVTTDFFNRKLLSEAEIDFSKFDPDTRDEFPSKRDKAYRVKVGGASDIFSYEGSYEYLGTHYEVVGNQGIQKDREGFVFKGGVAHRIHNLAVSISRYNDNVERDNLMPRTYTYQGTLDYTLNKFPSFPMGLSYQKSRIDSRWEPSGVSPVKSDQDAVTARIGFVKGQLNFGLSASYSIQNDLTESNDDTTSVTLTFTPALTVEKPYLAISPNITFNRTSSSKTNVHTNTFTTSLDLRGDLLEKRLSYGFGGIYTVTKASNGSTNQDAFGSTADVSYLIVKNLWGFFNPSLGIKALYNRINDRALRHGTTEFAVFLVIQTSIPISF